MRRRLSLFTLAFLASFVCLQNDNSGAQQRELSPGNRDQAIQLVAANAQLPPAQGKAFVRYVTKENPYREWALWPGKGKLYPGKSPHGAFLTTYVNKPALRAIQQNATEMPDGAIVVKENYSPAKKLEAITAMYKKKGYAPSGGNWYWIKFSPSGKVDAQGKIGGCIKCHSTAPHDFLFTFGSGRS